MQVSTYIGAQGPLSRSARICSVESDVLGIERKCFQFGWYGLPSMIDEALGSGHAPG